MIVDSVEYYEKNAEEFVASTINADVSGLYKEFEKYLKPGNRILDLGCGSGRDSKYFIDHGYEVVAVDPSLAMCEKTKELSGVPVHRLKAEELPFENEFDAVWACASLIHVATENQSMVMKKISRALKQGGVLYSSWKYGTQERHEGQRTFTDMDTYMLRDILKEIPGLKMIKNWQTSDVRTERNDQIWFNVLLVKSEN